MKKLLLIAVIMIGFLAYVMQPSERPLRVGIVLGPSNDIMYMVKLAADSQGFPLETVVYKDYQQPNIELWRGEIDANIFQHAAYLESMSKDRGYDLVPVAKTILLPMGVYSKKVTNLEDLPDGATVVVPQAPPQTGRALTLLARSGLISLKSVSDAELNVDDIVENPRHLSFKLQDMAKLAGALEQAELVVIGSTYAVQAGLNPVRDALLCETADSPYAGVVAVRAKDRDSPAIRRLITLYQSPEISRYIQEQYHGEIIQAW